MSAPTNPNEFTGKRVLDPIRRLALITFAQVTRKPQQVKGDCVVPRHELHRQQQVARVRKIFSMKRRRETFPSNPMPNRRQARPIHGSFECALSVKTHILG